MKTALIIVDIEGDFLPEGALGVKGAHELVPVAQGLAPHYDVKIATLEIHPENHISFAKWGAHCVAGTKGAELHPGIASIPGLVVFTKGEDPEVDSPSGLRDDKGRSTGLHEFLQKEGVTHLDVMGLVTDVCVKATTLDSISMGYQTRLLAFASRAININPGDEDAALKEVQQAGGTIVHTAPEWTDRNPPEMLYSTPYLVLKRKRDWIYVSRTKGNGAVGIIAITEENKVLLVEQLRVPLGRNSIELPAGLVGDRTEGETPLEAAHKELLEETGYTAAVMEPFGAPLCGAAGLSDETIQLFVASGLKKVAAGGGTETENIVVHEIPLKYYMRWLLDQQALGKVTDSKTLALPGILLYKEGSIGQEQDPRTT